jgi:hypothetical protein
MARWVRGEPEVSALLASGELQKLTGDAANGERLQAKAVVTRDDATQEEAREAVENAEAILTAANGLIDQLGLF